MDQFKRMVRVMVITATPVTSSFLVVPYVEPENRFITVFIGGIISIGVASWIVICRSSEDAADI